MSSTASISANGGPAINNTTNSGGPQNITNGKTAMKTGRMNPQKAWGNGTNPLTQKPLASSQPNGVGNPPQKNSQSRISSKETNTADRHVHDRLTYFLGACIGLSVTITVNDGNKFEGIFSASSIEPADSSLTTKMTKRLHEAGLEQRQGAAGTPDAAYIGTAPDYIVTFHIKDVADVNVPDLSVPEPGRSFNSNSSSFRTDADISSSSSRAERVLQPWTGGPAAEVDLSLDSSDAKTWDQFETNKKMFGATSTYDEDLYTTRINRSDPSYKRREAEAARIAREIEGLATNNTHMREERGQALENDGEDEETKYSGVRRDDLNFPPLQSGQPNKYTPPARRAPAGQPTVPGVPVDPAIISAHMSRPEAQVKTKSISRQGDEDTTQNDAPTNLSPKSTNLSVSVAPSGESTKAMTEDDSVANATRLSVIPNKTIPEETRLSNASVSPQRKPGDVQNATEGVETEVLGRFREFANQEKLRVQERRRAQASHDKSAKIAELRKFSKQFKLGTAVPKDLVPILAKDQSKQEAIIEKANKEKEEKEREREEKAASVTSTPSQPKNQRVLVPATGVQKQDNSLASPMDRHNANRGRQGFPPTGPYATRDKATQNQGIHGSRNSNLLSHRLTSIQQDRKNGLVSNLPPPVPPPDMRIPPPVMVDHSGISSPQRQSAVQTPTSAVSTKFNAGASIFKPNPAASSFNPTGNNTQSSSPHSSARTRSTSRVQSPSAFFGLRKPKPASERPSASDAFNPIKRMKKEIEEQDKQKDYPFNGGIPQAYRTPPIWEVVGENQEKTYADMFEKAQPATVSPNSRSTPNSQMPHAHQLPYHLQNGNQHTGSVHTPHQTPHPIHAHHHQTPFDEHHRVPVTGASPHIYSSPRMQHSPMVYQPAMNHQGQMPYGQPVPQYYASQAGPSPIPLRQYAGAGPQFMHGQPGQVAAPMMVQQPSNGPYMGMPQQYPQPMYSPSPAHAYPHMAQPNGYPSPNRTAPMMMHQGSQQGHHPQHIGYSQPVYAPQQQGHMPPMRPAYPQQNPSYSSSPLQPQNYPQQAHRVPSSGYGAMPHKPPQHLHGHQGPPPNASNTYGNDGHDEGK